MLDHVESNGLGQRAALADSDNITLTNVQEGGGAVYGHVGVLLAKTSVLTDILKVITTDDHGSLHLVGHHHALKNATTNGHIAGEGALLVDVRALNSLGGGLETQTDVLVVSHALRKTHCFCFH